MTRVRKIAPSLLAMILLVASPMVFSAGGSSETGAETQEQEAVVGDIGYFLESQVDPGFDVYDQHCAICHGYNLMSGEMGGPPLTGQFFYNYWAGRTVGDMLEYIRENMPLGQGGSLSATQYARVTAYILDFNNFPAGEIPLEAGSEVLTQPIVQPEADQE